MLKGRACHFPERIAGLGLGEGYVSETVER